MDCGLLEECLFFNGTSSEAIAVLKEAYCKGNPLLCARRRIAIAVGHEWIPPELNPDHTHLVQDIIIAALSGQ